MLLQYLLSQHTLLGQELGVEIGKGCTTHMGQCHGLSMGMGGLRIFNPCLTPTHRGGSWVGLEGKWVDLRKISTPLPLKPLF